MGGVPEPEPYEFDVAEVFGEFEGSDWGSDDPLYHDANLARFMSDGDLHRLANNVCEWVDGTGSRVATGSSAEADGIRKLGMSKADLEAVRTAVPGAEWRSTATHSGADEGVHPVLGAGLHRAGPAGQPRRSSWAPPRRNASSRRCESLGS